MAEKPRHREMLVYMSGFLQKRQRGKHIKRENQRKKLKFQERYCVLNENSFIYSKKENSKVRGSFPVERIKIVNDTDQKAFRKGTITKPELCFQVGDECEMLYLKAFTEEFKKKWIDAFARAANVKGNVMLKSYHSGAYGSKVTGVWSCCEQSGLQAPSCTPTTYTGRTSLLTFNSVASDDTQISDTATGSSFQRSSSCESNMSGSIPVRQFVPVIFEDRSSPPRPRTETLESGIDVNQPEVEKKRKILLSTGSSEDESDVAPNFRYSSEDSVCGDEGIDPDEYKRHSSHTGIQKMYNMGYQSNQHVLPSTKMPHLVDFHKLPHPLTSLVLQHGTLISGNGMLQMWDTTDTLYLTLTLKLPGQTTSLDIWRDYIAVGSSVVQLIQLSPSSEPKRILYAKQNDLIQSALNPSYLVAFLSDKGDLASVRLGGSTVDIWAPPPCDSQIVLSPSSSVKTDEDGLLSLTGSKDSSYPWVAAMTRCRKLYIIDWSRKVSTIHYSVDLNSGHELKGLRQNSSQVLSHISGQNFVVGNERKLQVLNGQTGYITHSTEIENSISCLCCINGYIAVGTSNGEVKLFNFQTDGNLTKLYGFKDDKISGSVVAIAAEADLATVYVAHADGILNIWGNHPVVPSDLQNFQESIVGMQLCCEGILSHKRTFHFNSQESLTVSCADEDFYLQLPPEVLDYPNASLDVAFTSLGPVGAHFRFPEKMIPVSPAVWLCFSPQKKFLVPAKLKLPHCFKCETLEESQCLTLLKAEHKDIKRDENGYTSITFSKLSTSQSHFHQDGQYYTANDHHFCIYCLAVYHSENQVLGKVNYCLTILKPKRYPTDQNLRIYCILHFNLTGCKKLVREQTPDDYESVEKLLQFETEIESDRYKAALVIHVNKAEAQRDGWEITMESEKKIHAEDVNFFNYRNIGCLDAACCTSDVHKCYPYAYPPRFVLEVSSRYAEKYSTLELVFTGAKRELSTEIQLHPLRTEQDLHRITSLRQNGLRLPD